LAIRVGEDFANYPGRKLHPRLHFYELNSVHLPEWLQLNDQVIAEIVAPRVSTAVIYLNGTRRWFLSQSDKWAVYATITGAAQRRLCELFYAHGIETLIQPLMGYDLLSRGQDYLQMAVAQGLAELTTKSTRTGFAGGDTPDLLRRLVERPIEMGLPRLQSNSNRLKRLRSTTQHKLLFGVFADEGLDHIVTMARGASSGEELLQQYYGQPIGPVDLIVGSGQPAIWDLPLLDVNKANLYFLQAPTFCLDKATLRCILHDHLYQRVNDDEPYHNLKLQEWGGFEVLGLGQRTRKGWIAS
jgi:hypothetical protein